jgi:hypothetical protein
VDRTLVIGDICDRGAEADLDRQSARCFAHLGTA